MLIQKFEDFKQDTTNIGNERLAKTNEVCDQLIGTGHSDAATIAQHKDTVNEAWANLLELMNTRIEVVGALLYDALFINKQNCRLPHNTHDRAILFCNVLCILPTCKNLIR